MIAFALGTSCKIRSISPFYEKDFNAWWKWFRHWFTESNQLRSTQRAELRAVEREETVTEALLRCKEPVPGPSGMILHRCTQWGISQIWNKTEIRGCESYRIHRWPITRVFVTWEIGDRLGNESVSHPYKSSGGLCVFASSFCTPVGVCLRLCVCVLYCPLPSNARPSSERSTCMPSADLGPDRCHSQSAISQEIHKASAAVHETVLSKAGEKRQPLR